MMHKKEVYIVSAQIVERFLHYFSIRFGIPPIQEVAPTVTVAQKVEGINIDLRCEEHILTLDSVLLQGLCYVSLIMIPPSSVELTIAKIIGRLYRSGKVFLWN